MMSFCEGKTRKNQNKNVVLFLFSNKMQNNILFLR